jgi:hypothetical protein
VLSDEQLEGLRRSAQTYAERGAHFKKHLKRID